MQQNAQPLYRPEVTRAYRHLQGALAFFVVVHVIALVSMGLLLRGVLDPSIPALERATTVAEQAWWIRLGWLPWQLCALSDLLTSFALFRYLNQRRRAVRSGGAGWAALGLLLTVVAALPEQWAEAMWVSRHITLAEEVVRGQAELSRWARASVDYDLLTGVWGNFFYVLATACWMIATRRASLEAAGKRGAAPGWLEMALLLFFLSAGAFLGLRSLTTSPVTEALFFGISGLFNGIAFPALMLWSLAWAHRLGELQREGIAKRAARVADPPLFWPRLRWLGAVAGSMGLRDMVRALFSPLPFPELNSDLGPVLYLNWMVPTERAAAYLPAPLVPHDLDGMTAVTALSYKHGSFGPRSLGPLRRLLPSPIQSNWRLYLPPPAGSEAGPEAGSGQHAVAFLINALDSPLYSLGARLGSDGLPAHLVRGARYAFARERDTLPAASPAAGPAASPGASLPDPEAARPGTEVSIELDPGEGSGPDLRARARSSREKRLPEAFAACFEGYQEAVAYLIHQDRAIRVMPGLGTLSESFIALDAHAEQVEPYELAEPVQSDWLHELVQDAECFAFVVPPFRFRTLGETLSPLPAADPRGGAVLS